MIGNVQVARECTVFVRPGLLHATGAGVFLVEAQEPTDFSIMAEYEGYPIDPDIAHMHKGWDTMLKVIDRAAVTQDELSTLCGPPQRVASNQTEGWTEDDIWRLWWLDLAEWCRQRGVEVPDDLASSMTTLLAFLDDTGGFERPR